MERVKFQEMVESSLKGIENTVGKREIIHYEPL